VIAAPTAEPWAASWDSATVAPGLHALEVRAYTNDGRNAVLAITVTTAPS